VQRMLVLPTTKTRFLPPFKRGGGGGENFWPENPCGSSKTDLCSHGLSDIHHHAGRNSHRFTPDIGPVPDGSGAERPRDCAGLVTAPDRSRARCGGIQLRSDHIIAAAFAGPFAVHAQRYWHHNQQRASVRRATRTGRSCPRISIRWVTCPLSLRMAPKRKGRPPHDGKHRTASPQGPAMRR